MEILVINNINQFQKYIYEKNAKIQNQKLLPKLKDEQKNEFFDQELDDDFIQWRINKYMAIRSRL